MDSGGLPRLEAFQIWAGMFGTVDEHSGLLHESQEVNVCSEVRRKLVLQALSIAALAQDTYLYTIAVGLASGSTLLLS